MEEKIQGKHKRRVYEIIKNANEISLKEISKRASDVNYSTIRNSVNHLTNDGFIIRVERGIYRIKEHHS